MFGSSIIGMIIELSAVIISLIILFFIGRFFWQKIDIIFQSISSQKKSLTEKIEPKKQETKIQNKSPSLFSILTNPQNKDLFEKFISLIDKIEWPKYPNGSLNKGEDNLSLSSDHLKKYDDEFKRVLEEEDKMYSLYINYLSSYNILISKTELSQAVEQYKKIKVKINMLSTEIMLGGF